MDRRNAMGSQSVVALDSTITRPDVGSIRRLTMRSRVVFPEPLRPSRAVVDPVVTLRSTRSRMTRPSGVVSPTDQRAMAVCCGLSVKWASLREIAWFSCGSVVKREIEVHGSCLLALIALGRPCPTWCSWRGLGQDG